MRGVLSESDPKRGLPFVSSMIVDAGLKKFERGYPVPLDPGFWASNPDDTIGGIPGQGSNVKFVIPNMVYDLVEDMKRHSSANQAMMPFTPQGSYSKGSVVENYGLFSKPQFQTLLSFLPPPSGSNFAISPEDVAMALNNSRAPTWYDALNFLIPTYLNEMEKIETPSVIARPNQVNGNVYRYNLYAPFYGENTLYQNLEEVKGVLDNFIKDSNYAISRYVQTMHEVATEIRTQSTAVDASKKHIYMTAADGFHNRPNDIENPGCFSQAGLFKQLFLGGSGPDGTCNIKPMPEQLKDYWSSSSNSEFYQAFYTLRPDTPSSNSTYMTGYLPGRRHGALDDDNGTVSLPFNQGGDNDQSISRRNFYSTKLIATNKILAGGNEAYISETLGAYNDSEGAMSGSGINTPGGNFANTLSADQLSEFAPLSH